MQSLLGVKLALEKQQKTEMAAAQERLDRFRRELAQLEDRLAEQCRAHNQKMAQGTDARELQILGIGFKALYERLERQRDTVRVAGEEHRRVQKKLVDTMAERKMLEKLKDKQWAQHREEMRREESVMIDDFLSNKLNARQQTGGGAHGQKN